MSEAYCERCNREMDEYESISYEDIEMCTECWSDLHFICCLCQSEVPEAQQGEIGNCLVVTHAEEAGAKIGLYEIIGHPYYYYGYVVMNLYEHSIRYIGNPPDSIDTEGYPVGHLCTECSTKLKALYSLDVKRETI